MTRTAIEMSNKVLIVFAGGYADESLACTFVGMTNHFRKDAASQVTALSNLNLATFLQRPEGLVFGRKEGRGGRLGVLTGFAHDRQRNYTVVPETSMKQDIQDWITLTAGQNIQNMTLVFVAHGYPPSDSIPVGTIALGWTPEASTLSPEELLAQLDQVPVAVRVNLILVPCFSGAFIEKGLAILTRRNIFIHASTSACDYAWPLRSASFQDRCSLFGAAVVEAINTNPRATIVEYEATVHSIIQVETQTQRTVPHTPELHVDPDNLWNVPVGNVLGYPSAIISRTTRRLYSAVTRVATSVFARTQHPQMPYGKDAELVKTMFAQIPPLPIPEMPMTYLGRKFREGWASEAEVRHLEEILNFRREAQEYTASLLNAWVSEGAVDLNVLAFSADGLTQSSKGTQENRMFLLRCLPELNSFERLNYSAGIYRYYDCTNFLANVVGLAGTTEAPRLIEIANSKLGISVSVRACGDSLRLSVPELRSELEIRAFDIHLPASREELRVWSRPEPLELLVPSRFRPLAPLPVTAQSPPPPLRS
jgi:hypothetical protein